MGKFCIKSLMKFGTYEHLYRLLKYGEIYMKNIDFYRKYELINPEHLRGDLYECYDKVSQHNTVRFLDNNFKINDVTIYKNYYTYTGYLFCMYAIYSNSNRNFDKRMLDFGEYAITIHNPKEFINRIIQYCKDNNIFPCYGPGSYFNENSQVSTLGPFMKREQYSYQSEARIYIHSFNPNDYFLFNIGNLEDIASLTKI